MNSILQVNVYKYVKCNYKIPPLLLSSVGRVNIVLLLPGVPTKSTQLHSGLILKERQVFTKEGKLKAALSAVTPFEPQVLVLMVLQPFQAVNGKTWLDIEHIPSQ